MPSPSLTSLEFIRNFARNFRVCNGENGIVQDFVRAVGSTGTETLGFQILKDNDVTLKNGKLTSTAVTSGK
ncbi:MAG: hypothetical protein IKA35_04390, partial [Bacteroidaceae bacterium]|nr:hypothetical protein [Bacteroidaceae bacterium]